LKPRPLFFTDFSFFWIPPFPAGCWLPLSVSRLLCLYEANDNIQVSSLFFFYLCSFFFDCSIFPKAISPPPPHLPPPHEDCFFPRGMLIRIRLELSVSYPARLRPIFVTRSSPFEATCLFLDHTPPCNPEIPLHLLEPILPGSLGASVLFFLPPPTYCSPQPPSSSSPRRGPPTLTRVSRFQF